MALKTRLGEGDAPVWADVMELIRHIEKEHRCRVVVEMALGTGTRPVLSVDTVAKRVAGRSDWYTCKYEVGRWPTHLARTMPALLVRMLWRLDEAMYDYDDLPILREAMPEEECPRPPSGS
jgi:hypothetical protein